VAVLVREGMGVAVAAVDVAVAVVSREGMASVEDVEAGAAWWRGSRVPRSSHVGEDVAAMCVDAAAHRVSENAAARGAAASHVPCRSRVPRWQREPQWRPELALPP